MTPSDAPLYESARTAALAWAAAMRQRKQPCVMKPWDENVLCLEPICTLVQETNNVSKQIVAPNPQRVGLIMTCNSPSVAGTLVNPGVAINPSSPVGLSLPGNTAPFMITQKDWLNLVSVAWFALNPNAGWQIAVIEIVLRDWPKV